jgi:rsbT co-antagonist protein RsbR
VRPIGKNTRVARTAGKFVRRKDHDQVYLLLSPNPQRHQCNDWDEEEKRGEKSLSDSRLLGLIERNESALLAEWQRLAADPSGYGEQQQFEENSRTFLGLLRRALVDGSLTDLSGQEWARMKDFLARLSRQGAEAGATPSETANFVFSFKQPLFQLLRREFSDSVTDLADESWQATLLIDQLGLQTTEAYQKSREEIIRRQQQELLEISTPVMRLWEGVLALPLIGTLDSARTQVVMENLLEAIVRYSAAIAIIDITGVPTVDTIVAQHLLKTVAAARLMGADCIISGIRPQIAQTIVHLGVDLADVITKATLADAFQIALRKIGATADKARKA